ncbi:MAG: hypothetical protein WC522_08990 [Candidatus Omnitrophota bacterium]
MRKCLAVFAVAVFLGAVTPVFAETGFNEAAACVRSWGKGCPAKSGSAEAVVTPKAAKITDALGNKVSTMTDNSGKSTLGH